MSAHLETLRARARGLGLRLEVCRESSGVRRYALLRADWRAGMPVLWYSTLGAVATALTVPM